MEISDLRHVPQFSALIADRCWHAWWTESNVSQDEYYRHIEAMTVSDSIPLAIVAHDNGVYVGSVLLIENDLEQRPEYAPWIAALWVEPAYRRRGVALKLILAAQDKALQLKHEISYLCATRENSPYYAERGFLLVEEDVEGLNIFSLVNKH